MTERLSPRRASTPISSAPMVRSKSDRPSLALKAANMSSCAVSTPGSPSVGPSTEPINATASFTAWEMDKVLRLSVSLHTPFFLVPDSPVLLTTLSPFRYEWVGDIPIAVVTRSGSSSGPWKRIDVWPKLLGKRAVGRDASLSRAKNREAAMQEKPQTARPPSDRVP